MMGELLILGQGCLPPDATPAPPAEALRHTPFPTLRLWQGLRALAADGLPLRVIVESPTAHASPQTWTQASLAGRAFRWRGCPPGGLEDALLAALRERPPAAVVSLGPFAPARAASLTPAGIPTWIDLPGDLLAEAQLRGAGHSETYRALLEGALSRGDAFSVCSERQKGALLGQLGMSGRLGPGALGWEGVSVIPPGVDPTWLSPGPHPLPAGVPEGAPLVVHLGSINTWSDTDALGDALELALGAHPLAHFVGVGGRVVGHDAAPADALWGRLSRSAVGPRCRDLGWIPPDALLGLLDRAAVGITLDRPTPEAFLGARTRLALGVARGMPWVLTPLGEGSARLAGLGLATPVPPGDGCRAGAALAERLRAQRGEVTPARSYLESLSPGETMAPLRAWARAPGLGPPAEGPGMGVEARLRGEAELRALRQSPTFRLLNRLHRLALRIK